MEENVWSDSRIYSLLKEEYVLISLYVDERKALSDDEQFDFQYESGRIKNIETTGQKWGTFQTINFNAASQPYYVLLSPDLELLNSAVQYTDIEAYETWLKSGLEKYLLSME
jgi:thiol:disulfide interchange protein DsbD